jgi:hypothetical protein
LLRLNSATAALINERMHRDHPSTRRRAEMVQGLLTKDFGISLAGFGKLDDPLGEHFGGAIAPV